MTKVLHQDQIKWVSKLKQLRSVIFLCLTPKSGCVSPSKNVKKGKQKIDIWNTEIQSLVRLLSPLLLNKIFTVFKKISSDCLI